MLLWEMEALLTSCDQDESELSHARGCSHLGSGVHREQQMVLGAHRGQQCTLSRARQQRRALPGAQGSAGRLHGTHEAAPAERLQGTSIHSSQSVVVVQGLHVALAFSGSEIGSHGVETTTDLQALFMGRNLDSQRVPCSAMFGGGGEGGRCGCAETKQNENAEPCGCHIHEIGCITMDGIGRDDSFGPWL